MQPARNPLLVSLGLLTAVLPTTCLFVSVNIYFFVPLIIGLGCVVVGCFRMSDVGKRSATALGLFMCLAAAVGPFALAAYANRSGKPIRIVLPVGYRGEFSIVKDRAKGQDLKLHNGVWIFEIPESGVLFVNDDYPFYMWHHESYLYSDGRPARVASLGTSAGSIQTDPDTSRANTDYDGTTHQWKVTVAP